MIIDIKLKRPSVRQEGRGKEIQVGEKEFSFIELGAHKETAAIIEHIEHGEVEGAEREPVVWGGIELPELPNLRTLPTADGSRRLASGFAMGMAILQRPVAYLSTIELKVVKT